MASKTDRRGTVDESLHVGGVQVQDLPLGTVRSGVTPRSSGPDMEHITVLAQIDSPLPPNVLHRPTMRVIDGIRRMEAARLRGYKTIPARLVDGGEDTPFLVAVRANVTHGMPLSLPDRVAAASRILHSYAQMSDRAVGVDVRAGTSGRSRRPGLDYRTLRNYAWVVRRFDRSRRRVELSFQHHAELAAPPAEEQDRWRQAAFAGSVASMASMCHGAYVGKSTKKDQFGKFGIGSVFPRGMNDSGRDCR